MLSTTVLVSVAAMQVPFASALEMSFFGNFVLQGPTDKPIGVGCTGDPGSTVELGADTNKCHTFNTDTSYSCVVITPTAPEDDRYNLVWFSTNDCNPSAISGYGDKGSHKLEKFKSYQVWDLLAEDGEYFSKTRGLPIF